MRTEHTILLLTAGMLALVVGFIVSSTLQEPEFVEGSPSFAVAGMPTLVDLSVDWCGPCKQLEPILREMAKKYQGRAAIVIVNPEKDRRAREIYKPRGYPTLVFHRADGSVHRRITGAPGKRDIERIFAEMGVQ